MAFCNTCGTQIAEGSFTCAACAARAAGAAPPSCATPGSMPDKVAGMLAYATFIPAIIFLVMEPYNKSRFVRFHSYQCIFLFLVAFALHLALGIVSIIPFLIILTLPLHKLITLVVIGVLVFLALKANQGQMYKLPVIGDMAEKQANAM